MMKMESQRQLRKHSKRYSKKDVDRINAIKFKKNGLIGILTRKYISSNITKIIAGTAIKPNQITFFALFLGLIGCVLVSTGQSSYLIYAGIVLFISKVFDSVDGELARVKGLQSKKGAWLDALSDRFKENILIFCITLGLFNQTGEVIVWYYGFIATIGLHMQAVVLEYTGQMDKKALQTTQEDTFLVKLARKIRIKPQFLALQADTYLFFTFVLIVFNKLLYALWFHMIVLNLYWILIVFFVYKAK